MWNFNLSFIVQISWNINRDKLLLSCRLHRLVLLRLNFIRFFRLRPATKVLEVFKVIFFLFCNCVIFDQIVDFLTFLCIYRFFKFLIKLRFHTFFVFYYNWFNFEKVIDTFLFLLNSQHFPSKMIKISHVVWYWNKVLSW